MRRKKDARNRKRMRVNQREKKTKGRIGREEEAWGRRGREAGRDKGRRRMEAIPGGERLKQEKDACQASALHECAKRSVRHCHTSKAFRKVLHFLRNTVGAPETQHWLNK